MTEWKPVVGYEGLYLVSDEGDVLSLYKNRLLSPGINYKSGYKHVALYRDGVQKSYNVHALVMRAFVGPYPDGMEVRHLNGNPGDARLVNLAYGTARENQADRYAHGTAKVQRPACPKGHPWEGNTYQDSRQRHCRICRTERNRRYAAKKRANGYRFVRGIGWRK